MVTAFSGASTGLQTRIGRWISIGCLAALSISMHLQIVQLCCLNKENATIPRIAMASKRLVMVPGWSFVSSALTSEAEVLVHQKLANARVRSSDNCKTHNSAYEDC